MPRVHASHIQAIQGLTSEMCGKAQADSLHNVVAAGDEHQGNKELVIIVNFEAWEMYNDVLLSRFYASFLALILFLWAVSMLDELHSIAHWWLLSYKSFCVAGTWLDCTDSAISVDED